MPEGKCPECEAQVEVANPSLDETLECDECGIDLVVVGLDPLELDVDPNVDDDDDDDEDDD